jgi:serine/threonine protein kinase
MVREYVSTFSSIQNTDIDFMTSYPVIYGHSAMKVLKKSYIIKKNQIDHTKAERSILQHLQHPFIVNLNFAFQNETKLYLILDFVGGGELFFWLKSVRKFDLVMQRYLSIPSTNPLSLNLQCICYLLYINIHRNVPLCMVLRFSLHLNISIVMI